MAYRYRLFYVFRESTPTPLSFEKFFPPNSAEMSSRQSSLLTALVIHVLTALMSQCLDLLRLRLSSLGETRAIVELWSFPHHRRRLLHRGDCRIAPSRLDCFRCRNRQDAEEEVVDFGESFRGIVDEEGRTTRGELVDLQAACWSVFLPLLSIPSRIVRIIALLIFEIRQPNFNSTLKPITIRTTLELPPPKLVDPTTNPTLVDRRCLPSNPPPTMNQSSRSNRTNLDPALRLNDQRRRYDRKEILNPEATSLPDPVLPILPSPTRKESPLPTIPSRKMNSVPISRRKSRN